jgi:hypothetical protein
MGQIDEKPRHAGLSVTRVRAVLSHMLSPAARHLALRRRLSLALASLVGLGVLVAVPAPALAAAPSNDDFANAQVLTGNDVTVNGSNVDATMEAGEPRPTWESVASVWYSWTAPADGDATVDLIGSTFNTVVGVYTGASVDDLTLIVANDDAFNRTSRADFEVVAGTTYRIMVAGGSPGDTGSITLRTSFYSALTGTITGTLVDWRQNSVDGACVNAYTSKGMSAAQVDTDPWGRYTIRGLDPGDYRVGFGGCSDGLVPEFYADAATYEQAQAVTVVAKQTTVADAQVSRPNDPGIVSGRVTDTAGNPLSDICVNVAVVDTNKTWQIRTDGDGLYRAEVDPGTYTAQFFSCSLGYPIEQWYDGKTQATATTFTVVVGQETPDIDAHMVIGGQVAGTVKNDAGTALARVCVDLLDQAGVRVQDAVGTSSDGSYRFRNVVPGTYVVKYRNCNNVGPYADEYFKDSPTLAEATSVVVPAGGTTVADGVLETVPAPDTVILTGPTAGSTIASTSATFTFAGDPAAGAISFMCRTGTTGSYSACTSPRTITNLSQGLRTFSVYAVGRGGTRDATPASRSFTVDTTPPNTAISSGPTAGSTITANKATFAFAGTSSDAVKFQCRVDDAAWADCTSPTTFEDLAEGAHTAAFRAQDAVGNTDQSPATRAFTVDTVAPDTTIDSGPTGPIDKNAATFEFHGTAGDTAKIQCQVDAAAWADCTSPLGLTDLAEGDHTVSFRAQDARGLQDATPAVRSFTVDTIAPDTTIDSGPTGTITTDKATFEISGSSDTAKLQCRLDDATWNDCTSPATFDKLTDGDHTVAFRAQDAVGNTDQSPATRTFTVDTTAPDTTIDSGPTGTIANDTATFEFSGTDATAKLQCRLDDDAWKDDCTSPATFDKLTDGDHTVAFRAQDTAGNTDQSPATRTFTVDTTAPDTTIDSGPEAGGSIATRSTTFTFHGTVGDTARLQCRLDDGTWSDCTSPVNLTKLGDGTHEVAFRAVDAVGNVDASPATRSFRVVVPVVAPPQPQPQTQPPATTRLTLTAPGKVSSKKSKAKVTVKIQLRGVSAGTIVIRDGKKIVKTVTVTGKRSVTLNLKAGTHRLTASFAGTTVAKASASSVRKVVVKRKR